MNFWTLVANNPVGNHGGFGFNGNILETNILNLAVVIGILVYYGGDFLSSLLETRKQTIMKSLNDAEARYQEAMKQLEDAKTEFEVAKSEAESIMQGVASGVETMLARLEDVAKQENLRLEESRDTLLQLEQDKAIRFVSQQVARLAVALTYSKIDAQLKKPSWPERILDARVDYFLGDMDRSELSS